MGNRVLDQKILKKKRRGKYRQHSGAPSRFTAERVGPTPFTEDEVNGHVIIKTGKTVMIAAGEIKFGRQTVNNAEDGRPIRRGIWKEAKDFLDNFHANIPLRRDDNTG